MNGLFLLCMLGAAPVESKIDEPLKLGMVASGRTPVLILGSKQFLEGPNGLTEFAKKNRSAKRRELRKRLISEYRKIAKDEQVEILAALPPEARAKSLWLVNSVAAECTPEEIKKLEELKSVKFIYLAEAPLAAPKIDKVGVVLKPAERKPFSLEGKSVPWNLELIGAKRVWEEFKVTGEGVLIASLDTGVDYLHPDLSANIWRNPGETPNNGKDDDGNGLVDDYYGFDFGQMACEMRVTGMQGHHGTMTAGISVGNGAGGTLTGIAPSAQLMALRMGPTPAAIMSQQYALEVGADVVNMSFSIPNKANLRGVWRLMCDQAVAAGLVQVSGAGNFQQNQPIPVQQRVPEDIPSVISVGGVDREMKLRPFSSMGPVEWSKVKFYEDYPMPAGLTKPDVAGLPGPEYPMLKPGSGYIDPNPNVMGNSFSSPHGTGVCALILSANPELPAWRVKEILESTARDIDPPGKDNQTGAGLMDAYAAVKAALAAKS